MAICAICGIITAVSGISLLIFVFVFRIKPEPVKPDKTVLPYQNFETLDEHLRRSWGKAGTKVTRGLSWMTKAPCGSSQESINCQNWTFLQ